MGSKIKLKKKYKYTKNQQQKKTATKFPKAQKNEGWLMDVSNVKKKMEEGNGGGLKQFAPKLFSSLAL